MYNQNKIYSVTNNLINFILVEFLQRARQKKNSSHIQTQWMEVRLLNEIIEELCDIIDNNWTDNVNDGFGMKHIEGGSQ